MKTHERDGGRIKWERLTEENSRRKTDGGAAAIRGKSRPRKSGGGASRHQTGSDGYPSDDTIFET